MAAGDAYELQQQPAAGAVVDSDAGLTGTEEAVVHNIYHEDGVTVERGDGTNWFPFLSDPGEGVLGNLQLRIRKGGHRIRVKNDHASAAKYVAIDGVKTK